MATFPPDLEAYIQQKVTSGQFSSPHELTIEALRLYREIETKRAQLKADIQEAIDEADRGLCEPLDIDAIKAELDADLDSLGLPE
jgi:putative addiction module CopG family antidote